MPKNPPSAPPVAPAVLDPDFAPAVLLNRQYREAVARAGVAVPLRIALERENGLVSRGDIELLADGGADSVRYAERHIKFLLWARGGWKLHLSGPEDVCRALRAAYAPGGGRAFDASLMQRVYDREFTVVLAGEDGLPEPCSRTSTIGGHLNGCRVGFDLGASDYKLAAVRDGKPLFSAEIPWHPVAQNDPDYHYRHIVDGLRRAAAHLPRLDAIGGSAAGIYVDNQVKVASLFRGVPTEVFERKVKPMFRRIQGEFGVPLVVANDGDVTALAGAMSLNARGMLGIAMGSSEAAGFLDREGRITGFLNELAFCPVDVNPAAPAEEWSGDQGVGALYFSQQAVNKLAPAAGFAFEADVPLPERLEQVQSRADAGDPAAGAVFETIGVYLGYALPHYADYYAFDDVLILGRVTSGKGGDILLQTARQVLQSEFPQMADRLRIHVPDEKIRRVGQAVAAASLPELA